MQTSVDIINNQAVPGLVPNLDARKSTWMNYATPLFFGRVASRGDLDEVEVEVLASKMRCDPFDASDATPVGVTIRDVTRTAGYYEAYKPVALVHDGQIWIAAEGELEPDDSVYIVYQGRKQTQTITFSDEFVASNNITMTVNGEDVDVTYAVSHDNTMDLLIAAIEAIDGVDSCADGGAGSKVLTIVSDTNGEDVTIADVEVTGGASQPTAEVAETYASITDAEAYGKIRADDGSADGGQTRAVVNTDISIFRGVMAEDEYPAALCKVRFL